MIVPINLYFFSLFHFSGPKDCDRTNPYTLQEAIIDFLEAMMLVMKAEMQVTEVIMSVQETKITRRTTGARGYEFKLFQIIV